MAPCSWMWWPTFHALFCRVLISGLYLVYLCSRAWSGNLWCQHANSMN